MKRVAVLVLVVLGLGCAGPSSTEETGSADQALAKKKRAGGSRFLVAYKGESLPANVAEQVAAAGGRVSLQLGEIGVVTATGGADFATRMGKNPDVLAVGSEGMDALPEVTQQPLDEEGEAVGPDAALEGFLGPTPADNLYYYLWGVRRIGAPQAWAQVSAEAQQQVTVAVLDTGIMHTHPDLSGQVVASVATNYCYEVGGTPAAPGFPVYSQYIDFDAHPDWDPSMGCSTGAAKYEAHGTHVAGTIAAKAGGGRVIGVAPGVRLAAYKVFDRYRYTTETGAVVDAVGAFRGPILAAIIDAVNHHYPIISMSLGGTYDRSNADDNAAWIAEDRVAKYANRMGTLIIASAGNAALDLNGNLAHLPSDLPTVMSTSASSSTDMQLVGGLYTPASGSDVLASYSNYGSAVDLAGPGGDCIATGCFAPYFILSTIILGNGAPAYAFYAGTSMATPHVSATAALAVAAHPGMTPGDLRAHLKATGEMVGTRQFFGHGLVRADLASQ